MPLRRHFGKVVAATLLVAVCPVLVVWWLRTSGMIESAPLAMVLAMALSLGASYLGSAFWQTRSGSGDLLFGELMIWGFVRRWRAERRLASALALIGSMNRAQTRVAGGLTAEAQAKALEQLVWALEATDPHTHGHSRRVARTAWMVAKRMNLPREQVARIRTAAAVHDVGKLETPTSILRKPGPLTDEEFDVVKRHPLDGARMVAVLGDAELTSIVRHHHERIDGTGYPSGLSGEEIPLGARIIAVVDTFDAITSARPYRATRSHRKALDILKYEAGLQLDPTAVRAFCGIYVGRRPLALWASLTSLPVQAFSWLAGGAAGVATAAQVAAVTAVAAVGTATLARPVAPSHETLAIASTSLPAAIHSLAAQATPSKPGVSLSAPAGPGPYRVDQEPASEPRVAGPSPGVASSTESSGPAPSMPSSGEGGGAQASGGGGGSAPATGEDGAGTKGTVSGEGRDSGAASGEGNGTAPISREGKGKVPASGERKGRHPAAGAGAGAGEGRDHSPAPGPGEGQPPATGPGKRRPPAPRAGAGEEGGRSPAPSPGEGSPPAPGPGEAEGRGRPPGAGEAKGRGRAPAAREGEGNGRSSTSGEGEAKGRGSSSGP